MRGHNSGLSRGTSQIIPLLSPLDDRRQPLVHQESDSDVNHPLDKGKGHVEHQQALGYALHRRNDRLVRGEYCLLGHEFVVHRIYDKVVGEYTDNPHYESTGDTACYGGLFCFVHFFEWL